MQGREEPAELFLKVVQVGDGAVGEVGRFKDEALGDITAAPQVIEQDQIADKETVGWTFRHILYALGLLPPGIFDHLLNPDEVGHELLDGANGFALVDGEAGFADMRHRPFHVRAGGAARSHAGGGRAQTGLGSPGAGRAILPPGFNRLDLGGVHDFSAVFGWFLNRLM